MGFYKTSGNTFLHIGINPEQGHCDQLYLCSLRMLRKKNIYFKTCRNHIILLWAAQWNSDSHLLYSKKSAGLNLCRTLYVWSLDLFPTHVGFHQRLPQTSNMHASLNDIFELKCEPIIAVPLVCSVLVYSTGLLPIA